MVEQINDGQLTRKTLMSN